MTRHVTKRPKNYLTPGEHRRLFWRFMPPAVVVVLLAGWVERTWFREPQPPPPPQVDTRLDRPLDDASEPDAVLIEPEPDWLDPAAHDDHLLGASRESLERVRDDTVFRSDDRDAWFELWRTLRDQGSPDAAAAYRVSFTELYGQPRSFRGRPIAMAGTLRRLERVEAPENDLGIDGYWQGWLEPEAGPASPVVVYFLVIPDGMPEGLSIAEPIDVTGYFFKRWAYAAKDTVRTAPMIVAAAPRWTPRPDIRPAAESIGGFAIATMAALVLLTLVGIRLAGRGGARPPAPIADIAAALEGAEIVSPEEALRRLAESSEEPPKEAAS
ncbi:MAG: hypothetical protein ACKOYJ_05655 [Planctomycetia bacterium]